MSIAAQPARRGAAREAGAGATELIEADVRELVRRRGIDPVGEPRQVRALVHEVIAEYEDRSARSSLPPVGDARVTARVVLDAVAGFGPLQRYLDDRTVEEIWINEPGGLFTCLHTVAYESWMTPYTRE